MIKIDTHLHTHYSHGKATVEAMFHAARAKGIDIIGFSEHSPRPSSHTYPSDYQQRLTDGFANYVNDVQNIRSAHKHEATVLLGLEMDWLEGHETFSAETVKAHDFDYVIGGIHFLDTWGFDYRREDWRTLGEERLAALYAQFFTTMGAMARTGLFNIVAHPDIIKIFSIHLFREWATGEQAKTLFHDALTAVRDAGMAMEVSSAGLRKPCEEIYPCPQIMELAAERGLPISFGSDAHSEASVGFAFDRLAAYARDFGYTDSVYFVKGRMHSRPF